MPVTFNEKTQKWVADYTDQFGKRHRHGFKSKKEAKAELVGKEAEIQSRHYRPEAHKTKLREVAEQFIFIQQRRVQHDELDAVTFHDYQATVRRYILADLDLGSSRWPERRGKFFSYPLGELNVGDIEPADVSEFHARLRDLKLSPATVKAVARCLSFVFALAVEKNLIAVNPTKIVKLRRTRAEQKIEISPPEKSVVAALIQAAKNRDGNFDLAIMFAALTGLRSSEQRALRWNCVDLEKRTIRVEVRVNRLRQLGPPKSAAGRRTVPLSARLANNLADWRTVSAYSGPDDLVFPNDAGLHEWHGVMLKRYYNPAWKRAEQDWKGDQPLIRCGWHYLRHFAISCWIEAGVPLKQVQKWAGHATASMTLDLYGHLFKAADHSSMMDAVVGEIWE